MTEIATEDDLWKLFFKEPKDHKEQGDGFILWEALSQVLQAKSFGDGTQALKIKCENRFYHVVGGGCHAVVRQCDLRKVARSLNGMAGDTMVGYLGTAQV